MRLVGWQANGHHREEAGSGTALPAPGHALPPWVGTLSHTHSYTHEHTDTGTHTFALQNDPGDRIRFQG